MTTKEYRERNREKIREGVLHGVPRDVPRTPHAARDASGIRHRIASVQEGRGNRVQQPT